MSPVEEEPQTPTMKSSKSGMSTQARVHDNAVTQKESGSGGSGGSGAPMSSATLAQTTTPQRARGAPEGLPGPAKGLGGKGLGELVTARRAAWCVRERRKQLSLHAKPCLRQAFGKPSAESAPQLLNWFSEGLSLWRSVALFLSHRSGTGRNAPRARCRQGGRPPGKAALLALEKPEGLGHESVRGEALV